MNNYMNKKLVQKISTLILLGIGFMMLGMNISEGKSIIGGILFIVVGSFYYFFIMK